MIIFNAFGGEKPRYNYVRGLQDLKQVDYLYILDDFGYKGSYLLYENGDDTVRKTTEELISLYIREGGYKRVITAGSSKGGTCAIYYGLTFNANHIFSGACQYNIGSFLHRPDHEPIFKAMMGKDSGQPQADLLNSVMPNKLEKHMNSYSGTIHLLYSKKDRTYERQLIDLIKKLKICQYSFVEIEEFFENHDDVGKPFLNYMRKFLFNEMF